ncbi:hypothetical protein [Parapedobacter soli]|uniref:hypothetical protein n=1 Tax=Parapedobacter soli TaxID=416955 RepID=UPI0021C78646|nr:hypothetical protein [Parapedobacter soli]
MKSILILLACISFTLLAGTAHSQSLEQLLAPEIGTLDSAKGPAVLQPLANSFERIALAHPKSWHANYYAAYTYTLLAFAAPKDQIDALGDRAQEYLDLAMAIRPNDTENHILAAYLLSARINANPMVRGASMGRESKTHLTAALEQEPDNPRALFVRGMGIYHTPAVFGGGKKKAKPFLDRALEAFDAIDSDAPLAPRWGRRETAQLLAEYK